MKAIIDGFFNMVISKKLTVFMLSTIFMFLDKIEPNDWIHLAMVYIGTQGTIDLIKQLRS